MDGIILANNELGKDPNEIDTVQKNLDGFNQQHIKLAAATRQFQDTAGLSNGTLVQSVDNELMNNTTITRESIEHALNI